MQLDYGLFDEEKIIGTSGQNLKGYIMGSIHGNLLFREDYCKIKPNYFDDYESERYYQNIEKLVRNSSRNHVNVPVIDRKMTIELLIYLLLLYYLTGSWNQNSFLH